MIAPLESVIEPELDPAAPASELPAGVPPEDPASPAAGPGKLLALWLAGYNVTLTVSRLLRCRSCKDRE